MIQIKRKENSVRNLRLIGGWFVRTRTMAEWVPLMVRGDTNHGGEHIVQLIGSEGRRLYNGKVVIE